MKKCKLCGEQTQVGFNINFKLVPVCEGCAATIFLQQARWYAGLPVDVIMKGMEKDAEAIKEHFKPHTLNQEYDSTEK